MKNPSDPRRGRKTRNQAEAHAEGTEAKSLVDIDADEWASLVSRCFRFLEEGPTPPGHDTHCMIWIGGDRGSGDGVGYISRENGTRNGRRARQNIRPHRIVYEVEHGRGSLADGDDLHKTCPTWKCERHWVVVKTQKTGTLL